MAPTYQFLKAEFESYENTGNAHPLLPTAHDIHVRLVQQYPPSCGTSNIII
jgi:hypothetical protein